MPRLALLLVALTAFVPVARAQSSTPLDGDPDARGRFAGEWAGGYDSPETGRHGTFVFRLAAGADSVEASVSMQPRARSGVPIPEAVVLAVHGVEITERSLRGVLARYDDPEWTLPLETTFEGTLVREGRLEGVFRAVGTQIDTVPQEGRWWATRISRSVPDGH